jgi:hypothetical protein
MIRPYVLTDLDHTLSNAFHRDPMIGVNSWDEYHAAAEHDEPLHDVVRLVQSLAAMDHFIIGITARPAKWRQLTVGKLTEWGVPVHDILMREDEDYRPSPEMKLALAREYFGSDEEIRAKVAMLLEDRDDVAAAFRGIGITVLQVFGRQHA